MERLDDLEFKGMRILQDDELYCFTIDSILLVNLSKVKKGALVVDLCSGAGIVPLLVAGKSRASKIYAFELQNRLADLAKRSVELNGLNEKIEVFNDYISNYAKYGLKNCADVVYCNPPYSRAGSAVLGNNQSRNIARLEITTNLKEVVRVASGLLKSNGVLYMVHEMKRLQEVMAELSSANLAVKELVPIAGNKNQVPHLLFVRAVKGGKCNCDVRLPLVLNKENGDLTDEVKSLYSKQSI